MERRFLLGMLVVAAFVQTGCGDPDEPACDDGFAFEEGACTDLDECTGEGAGHDCHADALCTNTAGSGVAS